MTAQVIRLPMDTAVFGLSCGRLELGDTPPTGARLDELIAEARELELGHIVARCPSEWDETCRELEARDFKLVIDSVSLEKALPGVAGATGGAGGDECVDLYQGEDDGRLIEITRQAFSSNTRFHLEPAFAPEAVTAFHDQWIRNLIADDAVWILVHRNTDRITGYVTVARESGSRRGHIGLIAVEEAGRGRGVGGLLVQGAESRFVSQLDTLSVMTESDNVAALSLYRRLGFRVTRSWRVLHSCLSSSSE